MKHHLSKIQLVTRDILLGMYYYSGMGWLYSIFWGRKRAIISFHNVLDEEFMREPYLFENGVSAQIFEKQIQYLIKNWSVQPFEKIYDTGIEGLFLTFDDGLRNHYTMVSASYSGDFSKFRQAGRAICCTCHP